MARSSYKNKTRSLPPAVMRLNYAIPVNTASTTHYLSISESVSRLTRRFYRQGLNWAVANVHIALLPADPAGVGSQCYVNTIPHTWPVANGWVKAFHAWKNQQDEAIAEMGGESGVAAFRDFKIAMESTHVLSNNLSPCSVGPGKFPFPGHVGLQVGAEVNAAEAWESSQIVIPNDGAVGVTNEYTLHMVGPSAATSKGIIHGYEFSRSYPQNPDPATPSMPTSWLNRMHDVGDNNDDIVDNAVDRNNELPYDQNEYPGGNTNFIELECQGYTLNQSTTGVNTYNTGPFTAPCGLIRVDIQGTTALETLGDYNIITVTLVPGNHRGYLAETMEEF